MLFALLHKNTIIGLFSNMKKCQQMSTGLVNNKFTQSKHLTIVSYYDNSITLYDMNEDDEGDDIIENFTTEETTVSEEKEVVLNSDTKDKIKKQQNKQSKIEYNINLLKQKKEQLEESKNVYKIDYELFKKFKKYQTEIPDFVIPELFQDKYNIMIELDNANNLSWESFRNKYKTSSIDTSYSKLFAGDKTRERSLLDIDSDSDPDSVSVPDSVS